MSELKCLYCGKPLTGKQAKFCSRSCRDRYAYARKPKKASKKPCKQCGKPTPDGRVSFCSAECRRAFYDDKPKPKRNVKPKLQHTGEQPCWTCAKAYGGCSWSRAFVPAEGWEAKPSKTHEDGYRIKMCPEYECDLGEYVRKR